MPPRPTRQAKRKRPAAPDPSEESENATPQQQHPARPSESPAPTENPSQGVATATTSTVPNDGSVSTGRDATSGSPTISATGDPPLTPWSGPLIGYCFCQDWKVTIKEPISGVVVCHCRDCQAISSSFFCTFLTVKSRALLKVEPRDRESRNVESATYYYTIKTGDNTGQSQSRTFCKRCGTVLFATPESLDGALPVNRNLFVGPHVEMTPALKELLTPKIEIFTKDRSSWRPGQEGVLHQYVSMPVGFGDSGSSDTNPPVPTGDLHL